MLIDYEHELTGNAGTGGGQDFTAGVTYGTKPYDLTESSTYTNGGFAGVGEPLQLLVKATANASNTSALVQLFSSDTGVVGGTEVLLCTRKILEADLATADGVILIGTVNPMEVGSNTRYLVLKVTQTGGAQTVSLKAWLSKASDAIGQYIVPKGTLDLD